MNARLSHEGHDLRLLEPVLEPLKQIRTENTIFQAKLAKLERNAKCWGTTRNRY